MQTHSNSSANPCALPVERAVLDAPVACCPPPVGATGASKIVATDPEGMVWAWEADRKPDGFDGYQTIHYAVARNGKRRALNWSRYQIYTGRHFIAYVTGGFPAHQKAPPYHPCLPACIEEMDCWAAVGVAA